MLRRFAEVHGSSNRRVVRMLGDFMFKDHLCIVFELLSISLLDLLRQNKYRGLSLSRIRLTAAQLLDALWFAQQKKKKKKKKERRRRRRKRKEEEKEQEKGGKAKDEQEGSQ